MLASTRPAMVVEALVRIAELRRRQGRLVDAADLFRQSGHHPLALLGRAQMALDAGRLGDAEDLSKRMLRQLPAENLTLRASALEVLVRTYSAGGDSPQAMESLRDLRAIAATINTPLLKASAALCEGVAAAGEGNYQRASAQLEDALLLFSAGGGLFEAAQCRLELARSLSVLGRVERAQEEAQAAAGSFKGLGALRDAERAETLLLSLKDAPGRTREWPSSLTNRESEVLRLLAKGLSNREIAAALTLSEHTVHRHVSNILSKLDLPSRSAAAAFAARLGF